VDIAGWIAQILAALVFGAHGYTLLFRPEQAMKQYPWATDVPEPVKRFIGVAEVLGAVGLILPAATRILPWLTPLAALGLVALMLLAAIFHLTRREWPNVVFNLVLGGIAAFVAYVRFAVPSA